ncbi:MAG: TetR/AcrR family transcriptional regulator [Pseudomonadota bacterium]
MSRSEKAAISDEGTSKTQAERTAASDRAMLAAAIELILERGTEGTTLQAIGERAGYSRGLATYRYGSKAGLFREVSTTIQLRWVGYLKAAVGDMTGVDALCAAADAYFQFVSDAPEDIRVLHILYYAGAAPNADVRGLAKQAFERQIDDAERWLVDGVAAGTVPETVSPRLVATEYVAHIAGITYIWLLNPGQIDFAEIHRDFKQTLRARLAVESRQQHAFNF